MDRRCCLPMRQVQSQLLNRCHIYLVGILSAGPLPFKITAQARLSRSAVLTISTISGVSASAKTRIGKWLGPKMPRDGRADQWIRIRGLAPFCRIIVFLTLNCHVSYHSVRKISTDLTNRADHFMG